MEEKHELYTFKDGFTMDCRFFVDKAGHKYGVEDWKKALAEKRFSEIAQYIQWGFTKDDMKMLAKLHESGYQREKIEDLLEDCNFHTERGLFIDGQYKEAIKRIMRR